VSVGLLDVNMLVAIGWSSHAHHKHALKWFAENRESGWATCPITQCGFVRLSCNSAFTPDAVTPVEAVRLLRKLAASGGHTFWPDELNMASDLMPADLVTGHRQVTDAYLLGLAMHHGGRLVTLDQKLASLVPPDSKVPKYLEMVPVEVD